MMKKYKLGELVKFSPQSIMPVPRKIYQLYSFPAFDSGRTPQIIDGINIQSGKYNVPNRCILFNKLNVRFKRIWLVDDSTPEKVCSTEFLPLIVNENLVDIQYCYCLLSSQYVTEYLCGINNNTSGSHKRINLDTLLNIAVALPSFERQRSIGCIFQNVEHKIALNRSLNHNLPILARSSEVGEVRHAA